MNIYIVTVYPPANSGPTTGHYIDSAWVEQANAVERKMHLETELKRTLKNVGDSSANSWHVKWTAIPATDGELRQREV